MKLYFQLRLTPEQRLRLERIARQQQRSVAEVLRQALDLGLAAVEADTAEVWAQREAILARARERLAGLKPIPENLIEAVRQAREEDMGRVWGEVSS